MVVRRCNVGIKADEASRNTIQYRSLTRLDETKFREDLHAAPWSMIETFNDPMDALTLWYAMFDNIVDHPTPLLSKHVKSLQLPPWMSTDILSTMRERLTMNTKNGVIPWESYKAFRNKCTSDIRMAKRSYFAQQVLSSKNDSKKLWKVLNQAVNRNSKNTIPTYVRDDNDKLLTDPTEIANAFNSYFSQVVGTINNGVVHNDPDLDTLQQFVADHLLKEIQELSCTKAKGVDSLNVHLLQIGHYELVTSFLYIYNFSIKSGVFPCEWKRSKVTPIFKKGSRQDKDNYHPISVLSVLSKILECHRGQRLLNFLLEYHLNESQFGSRPLHSCESLLIKLTDTWLDTMDKGDLIGLLLVDFQKAFDLVNHQLLIKNSPFMG